MHEVGTYAKGLMGEDRALSYLQSRGMALLCQRYHCPYGEIDLVMLDGDCIAFVEVKTRSAGKKGAGLLAITKAKQRRILQTALQYMAEFQPTQSMRFDALEITPAGVEYIPNAFEAGDIPLKSW